MQDLYWLDDAAWSRIEPLLPRGIGPARRRRWAWRGFMSLQVLMRAMTGFPASSSG